MVFLKRVLVLALALTVWLGIVAYGAIGGYWLSPIAAKGDTPAFLTAAKRIADAGSRGDMAFVLIRNGQVHAEHFALSIDAIDRETRFPLASMSKWITAYGVMQLVQTGKLDLDAPVSRYLTRWQLPEGPFNEDGVTVRRLLSHTAGLSDGLGFADYERAEAIPGLEDSLRQPRSSSGTAQIALGREPGSDWDYSGGGYLILQLLVEEVSGMGFAEWMQEAVFNPIGMTESSYAYIGDLDNAAKSYDASGKPAPSYRYAAAAATGLSASASDLIKFAQAQLRLGPAGTRGLPGDSALAMRVPQAKFFGLDFWGLGLILYAPTAGGDHVFGHDGANEPAINTAVRINPDNGDAIIVLVTGNRTLATTIASEWTLWQTGVPDFMMPDRIVASALLPLFGGLALIVAVFVGFLVWRRGATVASSRANSAMAGAHEPD